MKIYVHMLWAIKSSRLVINWSFWSSLAAENLKLTNVFQAALGPIIFRDLNVSIKQENERKYQLHEMRKM